ncbi:Med4p [Kluyveromyces lactis]|uniref:Mediator of RNA polymerase II transcription subunit 4 n=1 Tax=Kluyveromyces lactis (strain ATCC 8585 / CBS 2359 / DSM 70799 / NBRC 1267 / NRRL Y-1140 / WM37) TaxID=284590 RepID=MED4_KLULA|nr:uncharacterized protein KLLA0_F20185g [Kluyveromyces lactis]Q6CJA3.1 RecName: Full=Mediator of RNA polymerase II transcription subunit 4; AltName: Full=Mediator complex subunit 4 [Kluyveromyces lactis NRRL Y-1140]CAG98694.1 KLLA0F20185p [Kluyveromyces lactis]|eukprot:XP_455986.1 uncharacterized protein KLLA0_F20185g [Kluyveromyces lactis]
MSTPGPVPSSTSVATLPFSAQDKTQEQVSEELQSVGIYQDLERYEETIQQLSKSVDTFKPDLSLIDKVIECDKKLYETLEEFDEYYKIEEELSRLDKEQKNIDNKTREILETLNTCYNSLNELPMLEQVEFEQKVMLKQREKIHSKVVLDYAMKLAKFTRFPPTFDKSMIGPNNFIWPAEDSLRKGMLAMASLKKKELLLDALDEDNVNNDNNTSKIDEMRNTNEDSVDDRFNNKEQVQDATEDTERRGSFEFTANGKEDSETKSEENPDLELDLDLDLFNPDEF